MNPHLHLKKDKVLAGIISRVKLEESKPHNRYFEALCVAIINQQLSTKAADTIEKRFVALFAKGPERSRMGRRGKKFPKPEEVLKKPSATLRKAGLSMQKISYIKGIAKAIIKKQIDFNQFGQMTDEEIIVSLTKLKGIGRWSAEMFLMFSLARPDVFSHGDLGLKKAIKKWYKIEPHHYPKKYHRLVESWRPHRTTAARYLWASLKFIPSP